MKNNVWIFRFVDSCLQGHEFRVDINSHKLVRGDKQAKFNGDSFLQRVVMHGLTPDKPVQRIENTVLCAGCN